MCCGCGPTTSECQVAAGCGGWLATTTPGAVGAQSRANVIMCIIGQVHPAGRRASSRSGSGHHRAL